MPHYNDKDYRELIRELKKSGWIVEVMNSGSRHYRARSPDGKHAVHFGISGCPRALKNTRSWFRRVGFVW